MKKIQGDFSGGMNAWLDSSQIADNEYVYGINVRNRNGNLASINDSLELTDISVPHGLYQGLYAVGNILILFCSGKAYYKLYDTNVWIRVANLQLDRNVDRIYGAAVPISYNDYTRKAKSADDNTAGVKLGTAGLPSPACFICQDGISQPWVIFSDGTARLTQDYISWTLTNREYVPIGKQMMYLNGILFVVAANGKSVYRSVSGRPLDFVVNIDTNGNKGGDATTTSFAVDYNEISCIMPINAAGFLIATAYNTYLVQLDYDNTKFGEPTFIPGGSIIGTGIINNFSIVEILGDYALIDYQGIKSFNAVTQLKFKGANSIFSQKIANLFKNISQSDQCCAISFDNYALFSVLSNAGSICVVYDSINQTFCGYDQTAAAVIIQFAAVQTTTAQKLYAITADNKIYELYGSSSYAAATVKTKTWTANIDTTTDKANLVQIKATKCNIVIEGGRTGLLYATEYDDDLYAASYEASLVVTDVDVEFPINFPINLEQKSTNLKTLPGKGRQAYKIGYEFLWTSGGSLDTIEFIAENRNAVTPEQQRLQA